MLLKELYGILEELLVLDWLLLHKRLINVLDSRMLTGEVTRLIASPRQDICLVSVVVQ